MVSVSCRSFFKLTYLRSYLNWYLVKNSFTIILVSKKLQISPHMSKTESKTVKDCSFKKAKAKSISIFFHQHNN